MKTNLMPSATSAVVLSLLMLHPSPANAKNCKVRAADAYRAVIKKGWQFQCVTGSQTLPGALPFNRHGGAARRLSRQRRHQLLLEQSSLPRASRRLAALLSEHIVHQHQWRPAQRLAPQA